MGQEARNTNYNSEIPSEHKEFLFICLFIYLNCEGCPTLAQVAQDCHEISIHAYVYYGHPALADPVQAGQLD